MVSIGENAVVDVVMSLIIWLWKCQNRTLLGKLPQSLGIDGQMHMPINPFGEWWLFMTTTLRSLVQTSMLTWVLHIWSICNTIFMHHLLFAKYITLFVTFVCSTYCPLVLKLLWILGGIKLSNGSNYSRLWWHGRWWILYGRDRWYERFGAQ